MGKIRLTLALSLDGYIADEAGGYAWLTGDGQHDLDMKIGEPTHDFAQFTAESDIVVMGRHCYEEGMHLEFASKKVYIVTSQDLQGTDKLLFIKPEQALATILAEREQGQTIFLFGGGVTIRPFIEADLIDEYEIGIVPIILGNGRPLFGTTEQRIPLQLMSMTIEEGITIARYRRRKAE